MAPAGMALAEQGDVLRIRGQARRGRGGVPAGSRARPRAAAGTCACRGSLAVGQQRRPRRSAGCSLRRDGPVHRSWLLPAAVEVLVSARLLERRASIPTSSPASRRRSATPRSGRWRRTRRLSVDLASGETEGALSMRGSPVASGATSDRRTRPHGLESWWHVLCASWVMRIPQRRSLPLPAAAFAEVGAAPASPRRSTGCSGRVRPAGLTEREARGVETSGGRDAAIPISPGSWY